MKSRHLCFLLLFMAVLFQIVVLHRILLERSKASVLKQDFMDCHEFCMQQLSPELYGQLWSRKKREQILKLKRAYEAIWMDLDCFSSSPAEGTEVPLLQNRKKIRVTAVLCVWGWESLLKKRTGNG